MKVTIRIEQDKYHFVKRSFKSLEEAEIYISMAKVAKTKNDLKNWLSGESRWLTDEEVEKVREVLHG